MGDNVGSQMAAGAAAGATAGSLIAPGIGTVIGGGIGLLAPLVAKLIGDALASGDKDKARALTQQAIDQFGPDVLKAPEIAQLIPHLGPSAMAGVAADPATVAAQRAALQKMQQVGNEGANNVDFQGAVQQANLEANQEIGSQEGAIRQQMLAHGMGNSGTAYALQQQAAQAGANRAAGAGFNAAMEGRRQALQAMQAAGAQAGQMRDQEFDEGAARARAADEINRFNEMGRVNGYQQDWQNRYQRAVGASNAYNQGANAYNGYATQTQQAAANVGQGAGYGAAQVGQYYDQYQRDQDRKKQQQDPQSQGGTY